MPTADFVPGVSGGERDGGEGWAHNHTAIPVFLFK